MLGVDMDFSGSEQEQESQESLHLELEETEIDSLECSDVDSTTLTPLKKKRSRSALGRVRVLRPLSPTSDAGSESDSILVRNHWKQFTLNTLSDVPAMFCFKTI